MVAYTEFAGHRYCATQQQAEECQVYVIDLDGIKSFCKAYAGNKQAVVAYLKANEDLILKRMLKRGDGAQKAEERIFHDRAAFKGAEKLADFTVLVTDGKSPECIAKELWSGVLNIINLR